MAGDLESGSSITPPGEKPPTSMGMHNMPASSASPPDKSSAELAGSWSWRKKFFIATTAILMNFNVTLGSSLPSGASESLDAAFGVTSQFQVPLPVSIFLIGYIFGPIVFAPLSESWGRRPVFLCSFAIYIVFTLGCALAPNWPAFLFFRFMLGCGAAAPQTVSSGLFSDIYADPGPRGRAVTVLGLTSNVGPLVGPIISGFTSTTHWQRQFWIALILAGVIWPMLLIMPETFAPVLNAARRAAKAEQPSRGTPEAVEKSPKRFSLLVLTRPIRILGEPLVFFSASSTSTSSSSSTSAPTRSSSRAHMACRPAPRPSCSSPRASAPCWPSSSSSPGTPSTRAPSAATSRGRRGRNIGVCRWPASAALSSRSPSSGWAAPALSGIPLGVGIDLTFLALNNYLTDAYGVYSASALASSVCTRNMLASVVIPLATYPLYRRLGTAWACTLLGFRCLALVPIPFAFIRWGPALRAQSPSCQKMAQTWGASDY